MFFRIFCYNLFSDVDDDGKMTKNLDDFFADTKSWEISEICDEKVIVLHTYEANTATYTLATRFLIILCISLLITR